MPYAYARSKAWGPVSKLDRKEQRDVLAALVDGNSERGVHRMTGAARATVASYAMTFGTSAQWLHDGMAFGLRAEDIEQDEIWSYVKKKQARVTPEEHAAGLGEAYSFVSLAMPARYVITWKVGKRTAETAAAFEVDTRCRVTIMPRITTDGFNGYPAAIGGAWGVGIDYSQGVKHYRKKGRLDDDHRYEPPREPFLTKHVVFGAPDLDTSTTAHVERNNGTIRHFIGRMRRLVYAFSKDPAHHRAAVSLAYCYYNLCWIPRTMRITPAMAIGVTTHPWELEELLDGLLSAKPCELPAKQPLTFREPSTTARALPNGRGFLRVVPSGSGPSPAAPTPPASPAPAVTAAGSVGEGARGLLKPASQLDLFGWKRPSPPVVPSRRLPPGQLDLFGIDIDPGPSKT